MSGLNLTEFIGGSGDAPTNASPDPELVREPGDTHRNRSAAEATAACGGILRINQGDRRSTKKKVLVMTLASPAGRVFLLRPLLLPHSVSAALNAANLLPTISFPVLSPGLPISPCCRLIAAMLAAIACLGMIRPEYATAVLQQTHAGARPSRVSLDTGGLLLLLDFEVELSDVHEGPWELASPRSSRLEGDPFPFGAP